jgi:hypothetical protein
VEPHCRLRPLRAPIHRSAWNKNSANFAKNNALNGTKFIGNSSPLVIMRASLEERQLGYRTAVGLTSPALMKGGGAVRLEKDEALKE